MKSLTMPVILVTFSVISFGQIPIVTINTPPGTGPTAPQPQLVPCTPVVPTLPNTTWAFNDFGLNNGIVTQIGTFTVLPGLQGTSMRIAGTTSTNSFGTIFERLAPFTGKIDTSCLAGTNTVAAGTLQIAEGISGQILTWSYPITATFSGRNVTYSVTSTTLMNLSPYGAFDPVGPPPANANGTNGYADDGHYATSGTASEILGQVPCPANPNLVLDTSFSPNGFTSGPGTLIFNAGTGPVGTVTGNIFGATPIETGSYQVYPNCTGFALNIPVTFGGQIIGATFEGIFAAGDFSRAFAIIQGNLAFLPSLILTRK